jgi:hypothetical protein
MTPRPTSPATPQPDPALQAIEGAVLPSLVGLLEAVQEQAALARPGADAAARGAAVRRMACEAATLAGLLGRAAPAALPEAQPPARICA